MNLTFTLTQLTEWASEWVACFCFCVWKQTFPRCINNQCEGNIASGILLISITHQTRSLAHTDAQAVEASFFFFFFFFFFVLFVSLSFSSSSAFARDTALHCKWSSEPRRERETKWTFALNFNANWFRHISVSPVACLFSVHSSNWIDESPSLRIQAADAPMFSNLKDQQEKDAERERKLSLSPCPWFFSLLLCSLRFALACVNDVRAEHKVLVWNL